jgi:hypothetical protein
VAVGLRLGIAMFWPEVFLAAWYALMAAASCSASSTMENPSAVGAKSARLLRKVARRSAASAFFGNVAMIFSPAGASA